MECALLLFARNVAAVANLMTEREDKTDCYACNTEYLTTRRDVRRASPHNRLLCAACEAYEKGYGDGVASVSRELSSMTKWEAK